VASANRAILSVTLACTNQCVFCGQSGLPVESHASRDALVTELCALRETADEITFVGGEPTLHPDLDALIASARALGYRAIGVQTNGHAIDAERLRAWVASGLTDVHLSVHGHTAAAHDYHTGVEGSFVAALDAMKSARAASATVVVTTVLTRSNGRGLGELARVLGSRGAAAWCIAVPRVRGRAAELFDRVVPRLGVMMPFALHAVTVASALGLPTFLRGAPLCVLGPFARHSIADAERAYGASCATCEARARCPGVEPEYLERFAGDELSPSAPVAPTIDARLARMFVGEGRVAEPRQQAVPAAPATARVALPMLGKVQPARAEVPRTVEKKTGAALRELFKDLYREGGDEGTTE
jgi:hypothetical protein